MQRTMKLYRLPEVSESAHTINGEGATGLIQSRLLSLRLQRLQVCGR